MFQIKNLLIAACCVFVLGGCATTGTDGVVQIGPDLYMIGRLGKFTDFSGSAVKARLYQEAAEYCRKQGRIMVPVNSTGKDSNLGTYASAEIQFLSLSPSDPRVPKCRKKSRTRRQSQRPRAAVAHLER